MSWTVTFNSNKGSTVNSQVVENGDLVTEPSNVTKPNYVLLGWYTDPSFTLRWSFTEDTVTEDLTLYAKWRLTIFAKLKQILVGLQDDIDTKIPLAQKGQPEGVATLDANGQVPIGQINSDFNEIYAFETRQDFPNTGEEGKLYIDKAGQKVYRWSETKYRVIYNQTYLQTTEPQDMLEGDLWLSRD